MSPRVGTTTSCREVAGIAALGGGFVSDDVGHVVPLGNFGPGRVTMDGREFPWGERVVEGGTVIRVVCVGFREGLCLFACCCTEGFMLQGREDSLCVAKGFW